ncbi:MAG: N-acetyltransferase [Litorimonas sp.]
MGRRGLRANGPAGGGLIRAGLGFPGSRLAPLVLMSDPERTPDLLDLVAQMPSGSAVIYRHFGRPGLERRLRALTLSRGVQLLIAQDPQRAHAVGADGVHFTRHTPGDTLRRWRNARPGWIVTTSAAKGAKDPRPLDGLDGLFVSSIFASDSPSAGTPIGTGALKTFAADAPCPVFALGGITADTVGALHGTGVAGIASVGALARELRRNRTKTMTETQADNPVTISKQEGGEMIVFTADVAGSSATGELTLRRVADGVWNANHTGVPREIGGRGVGKALVRAMAEDARQSGYRVVPGCPFVAKLFERHPDWAEGVAA